MWEMVVLVLQFVCAAFVLAGALLSVWFKWVDGGRSERPAPPKIVASTEAVVKAAPSLKRAA
ncbi:MAG TPA: hypothetical protein VHJ82_09800 [Actinomycetota bacterium]|nr:hypothetical protein [Actinomycetota bacterium]